MTERVVQVCPRPLKGWQDGSPNPNRANNWPANVVVTTKYTFLTFIPKNLFEQFQRAANLWFLAMMILSQIPGLSPIAPITAVIPLVFVIGVTAIKQAIEDVGRWRSDRTVNRSPAHVMQADGSKIEVPFSHVEVGDVVYLRPGDEVPCDCVVLTSTDPLGECYVTMANVDGEAALKIRSAPEITRGQQDPKAFLENSRHPVSVTVAPPNANPRSFNGEMVTSQHEIPIGPDQLVLKGSIMKGAAVVYAVAVYSGPDTKISIGQGAVPSKVSSVERRLNSLLLIMLLIMFVLCAVSASMEIQYESKARRIFAAMGDENGYIGKHTGWAWQFLRFVILYANLIPISLYVTLEIQKVANALQIGWDENMYDMETGNRATARNSDLNEELGQIEYVFSDKTGTLTRNEMVFQGCSTTKDIYLYRNGMLVPFSEAAHADEKSFALNEKQNTKASPEIETLFRALSLCHSVQVSESTDSDGHTEFRYASTSADDVALVEAAALPFVGIQLVYRRGHDIELMHHHDGVREKYHLVHLCEFDHSRSRMSCVVRDASGKPFLFCKGADSSVLPRTIGYSDDSLINEHVLSFARSGLRTLVVAMKELSEEDIEATLRDIEAANKLVDGRSDALTELYNRLETDMTLLGSTAVEDRLQEGVKETIEMLKEGGCNVWVLTGDKVETAKTISYTVNHITDDMHLLEAYRLNTESEVRTVLGSHVQMVLRESENSTTRHEFALVIDGDTVGLALTHYPDLLRTLAMACNVVVGCRLLPSQKAAIVAMVKENPHPVSWLEYMLWGAPREPISLAIGDGANDVAMMMEAHVGVAILGKEGRQAYRSSDFAIPNFKSLARLLFVHGHYCHHRVSYTIQFFFYKGVMVIVPLFLYGTASLFSAYPVYDSWLLLCWNMIFTAAPVGFFGMFEKDLEPAHLISNPWVYRYYVGNRELTFSRFVAWCLAGGLESGIAYLVVAYLWIHSTAGGELFGAAIYTAILIVCTLRIAIDSRDWTVITHIGIWFFTFAVYIGFLIVSSEAIVSAPLYGVAVHLVTSQVWGAIIVYVIMGLVFELFLCILRRQFFPSATDVVERALWSNRKPGRIESIFWYVAGITSTNSATEDTSSLNERLI
eukprot:m.335291 g.335291  ORF g.335291 m.335291 type:complete len:1116 (-) comp17563_c0_seq1:541-3888(-)